MNQQTTRPTKKLGELTQGDFVHHRRNVDVEPGVVCEVKCVLPYQDGDGRPSVSALLAPVHGGAPLHVRQFANIEFFMATEGDVREAGEVARRVALAESLRQLAADIIDSRLPIPSYRVEFRGCLDSRAEVEAWAEHLAGKVRMGGTDKNIPVIDVERPVLDGLSLDLHFQGPIEPAAPADVTAAVDAPAGA